MVHFEMSLWYLQLSQKTNENIWLYYYGTSGRIVFVRFLGELKSPKRHFEINWPLSKNNKVKWTKRLGRLVGNMNKTNVNQHYCDLTKVKQFFGQCIKAVHVEANRIIITSTKLSSKQKFIHSCQITLEMDETCPKT